MAESPRKPTRRMRASDRRVVVLEAAMEVFANRGYRGASMDEIATHAGVTKPVLYRHVASKTDLYVILLHEQIEELLTRVASGIDIDSPPRERLRAGFIGFFEHVAERPFSRRMLFRDPEAEPAVQEAHDRVQSTATAGIAALLASEPTLLAGDRDRERTLEIFAELIKAGLNGLAAWWQEHPDVTADHLVDRSAELFWGGLGNLVQGPRQR